MRGSGSKRRRDAALLGEEREVGEDHRHAPARTQRREARVGGRRARRIAPDDDEIGAHAASFSAAARPMPDVPPVTTQSLPSSIRHVSPLRAGRGRRLDFGDDAPGLGVRRGERLAVEDARVVGRAVEERAPRPPASVAISMPAA